jgi:hypothetical protein
LEGIDNNIQHEAVLVPSGYCPFNDETLSLFEQGLTLLMDSGDLPPRYGVTLEEAGGDGFNEQEDINISLQKKKGFQLNSEARSGGLTQNFGHKHCLQ